MIPILVAGEVIHSELLQEIHACLPLRIQVHAHHVPLGIVFCHVLQDRQLLPARTAPPRPHVDHGGLTRKLLGQALRALLPSVRQAGKAHLGQLRIGLNVRRQPLTLLLHARHHVVHPQRFVRGGLIRLRALAFTRGAGCGRGFRLREDRCNQRHGCHRQSNDHSKYHCEQAGAIRDFRHGAHCYLVFSVGTKSWLVIPASSRRCSLSADLISAAASSGSFGPAMP